MTMKPLAICAVLLLAAGAARADDLPTVKLGIKDHRFVPAEVQVKAGQPTMLEITNQDATPEEFESGKLALEKVVVGGGTIKLRLRPLGPGRYNFFGDYHQDTAQGVIVAVP